MIGTVLMYDSYRDGGPFKRARYLQHRKTVMHEIKDKTSQTAVQTKQPKFSHYKEENIYDVTSYYFSDITNNKKKVI